MTQRRSLGSLWDRAFYGLMIRLQSEQAYRRIVAGIHPPYTISEASAGDRRAVARWLHAPELEARTDTPSMATDYVARSLGRVVGFGQLVCYPDEAGPQEGYWLYSLRVRIGWRGCAVGEALVRRVMDDARRAGPTRISLVVYADNTPAIALYRKLGFEQVHVPPLDAQFEREAATTGRRRIVMSRPL